MREFLEEAVRFFVVVGAFVAAGLWVAIGLAEGWL